MRKIRNLMATTIVTVAVVVTLGLLVYCYLLEDGYGLLMFDFRNHGESEGSRTLMGYHEIKDVLAAYRYPSAQDNVQQIIIWGYSVGGAVASHLMSEVEAIGLFIDATFGDFPAMV